MRFQRIANSIVTRILVLGIGIIIIGTAARYFMLADVLKKDLQQMSAGHLETVGTYVARDIGHKFSLRQSMLYQMAGTVPAELLEQPARLRDWLGERHQMQPLFSRGFAVMDTAGTLLASYPSRQRSSGFGQSDWRSSGGRESGFPAIGSLDGVPVLALSAPVQDKAGRVRAVLVGMTALAAPGFLDLFQESRIGEGGRLVLAFPGENVSVSAAGRGLELQPLPQQGTSPLYDRIRSGFRGTATSDEERGIGEIFSVLTVPGTDWLVVASLPAAEAFAPVERARVWVLRMSGVVVVIFFILAISGLYAVFRPLLLAADHADKMTRGELPLEPLPVVRADEVGHLTEAFNRLLTKLQSSQAKLAHMAHHDTLTGLPNRVLLADRLKQALIRARRHGNHLAVLYIDLDGFKPINDSMGHEVGDEALVEIARRLAAVLREADTLARVGGDEFVAVLGDLSPAAGTAEAAACAIAAKCIEAALPPLSLRGCSRSLGLSIGIALGDGRVSADRLLSAADSAMYQAKQSGRGRYAMAALNAPLPADLPSAG